MLLKSLKCTCRQASPCKRSDAEACRVQELITRSPASTPPADTSAETSGGRPARTMRHCQRPSPAIIWAPSSMFCCETTAALRKCGPPASAVAACAHDSSAYHSRLMTSAWMLECCVCTVQVFQHMLAAHLHQRHEARSSGLTIDRLSAAMTLILYSCSFHIC